MNPDKGNFALASGSDCTIAGAGMQNPTWSPVEATADDPVYLFPNYSFEENYSEFWTRHLEWGNNTTHALDDSQSYAGAKSLHLSSDGSNGRYFFSTDYRVSIKPNTEYTISIKVKAADGTAETAKHISHSVSATAPGRNITRIHSSAIRSPVRQTAGRC